MSFPGHGEAVDSLDGYRHIYNRYRNYTMIPEATYIRNLQIAERAREVEGCIVECGVWRGGMIAGIAELLGPERAYFLFDSFEGLPPAREIDGPDALAWQSAVDSPIYYDNCRAPVEMAEEAMRISGARQATMVKGWFADTLPGFRPPAPIALLRLDGDWHDSTLLSLNSLYPYVTDRGLVIVDDYATWDGCARAVHEFLARASPVRRIQRFEGDVCVLTPAKFWF